MKYLLGVLIVLFASYADIFLYRINIVPVPPSLFILPLFMVVFVIKYSIRDFFDLFKSHSFKFFASVLILSIIYSAFSQAKTEIIIENITLNTITLILYLFTLHFFRSEQKKIIFLVMLFSFISLAGSVFYDMFIGLPKYSLKLAQSVRKGGFGENPNQAASGIKFLALGILFLLKDLKTKKYIFLIIMVISVFITFSRSGIISVVLILIFGSMNNWSSKFEIDIIQILKSFFKMTFLFILLYISLLLLSEVIKQNFPAFTRGAAGERMNLLLGQSEKNVIAEDTGSGGGRGDLLLQYLSDFGDYPFGYGTGYSSDKHFNNLNTHNYYLYMAVNYGIIALILYLVFIWYGLNVSIKNNQFYYLIFTVLIIFEGFISHSIYHERSILVALAFLDSQIYRKNSI